MEHTKNEQQIAFVNALKAMDTIKTNEETRKEMVRKVFDIMSEKYKEWKNSKAN